MNNKDAEDTLALIAKTKAEMLLAEKRVGWQVKVSRWDAHKQLLPEPEFNLGELDVAEKIMNDLKR